MQKIGTFIKKATEIISDKTQEAFNNVQADLEKDEPNYQQQEHETSLVQNQIGRQQVRTPTHKLMEDQKVLEIDVIESGYLPKSDQEIKEAKNTLQRQQTYSKPHLELTNNDGSPPVSRLKHIQEEKKNILDELKKLDEEIAQIKGQQVEDGALKRREKEQQNQQAAKQAKGLVKQLKQQKKEMEERKRKQAEKALQILKEQEAERKAKQIEEITRAKEQKRKKIEARMQEQKRKKEERKQIEKESNRLLKQLKKEEQVFKQKEELPHETVEIEQKKKVYEKKQEVNFREIEEHERRYMQIKENQRQIKKQQRAESVNHHAPQYKKNMWLQQIEQQEQKKRQESLIKESMRKGQLDKRKKYGELVKNIFVPKQKKQTNIDEARDKVNTPDTAMLPRIPQSEKRVTDSKHMKKFTDQNRPFATAHNPKPPRSRQIDKKETQDFEQQKQRKLKEAQMRKQTKQRLKKLENKSIDALTRSVQKPKYENYLGKVKIKADNVATSWKKVIQNDNISKEDKYKEMLRRAAAMENKAKVKEEVKKDGDEQAVNLYIGSIQAKLAILQKF